MRKLGRRPPLHQIDIGRSRIVTNADGTRRAFARLGAHFTPAVAPPAHVDWSKKSLASIHNILDNDTLGCCVIASRYHNLGVLTGEESGTPAIPTDQEVRDTYVDACGPGDQGCDMSAVCTYRQNTGFPVQGVRHKTEGSTSVDNTNAALVRATIFVFGGLDVGLQLPQTWYDSANYSDWAPVPGDVIVGGHEVQAFGYDSKGVWVATWGQKRRILWSAFGVTTWVDEVYAELSPEWSANNNLSPSGFNAATLAADLQVIASGGVP